MYTYTTLLNLWNERCERHQKKLDMYIENSFWKGFFFSCMMNATFIQSLVDSWFPSSYPQSANESEMIKHNHKHWPNKVMLLLLLFLWKEKEHYLKKKKTWNAQREEVVPAFDGPTRWETKKRPKGNIKKMKKKKKKKGRREPNLHAASGQVVPPPPSERRKIK